MAGFFCTFFLKKMCLSCCFFINLLMRSICITVLSFFFFYFSSAQTPAIKWVEYPSTDNINQVIFDAKPTKDKGFILAGADKAGSDGKRIFLDRVAYFASPWLVKLDSSGKRQWSHVQEPDYTSGIYGINGHAYLSVQQTTDQGYVAAGYTNQWVLGGSAGDEPNCNFLVVRFNEDGTLQWQKAYGGTDDDRAYSIQPVGNSGFIVAGFAASTDEDVRGNHSPHLADVWLLRLDASGNILWKKCFGGSAADTAYAVIHTPDKGFLIAGSAASNNGNITGNFGETDAWAIKVDSSGNLLWQKNYGGSGHDGFKSVVLNPDGTYTFTGYSGSAAVSGNSNAGGRDLWVVKTTLNGEVIWSKLFGGSGDEQGYSVHTTPDGNNIISGYTESSDDIGSGNNGGADALLLKISPTGTLLWKKCIGTANSEASFAGLCLAENDFAVAGFGKQLGHSDFDGYVVRLGNANTIRGTLFKDDNLNGIRDANEGFFPMQATVNVQKQNGAYVRSQVVLTGSFSIGVDTGSYITSVQLNNDYYKVVPALKTFAFSTYFNTEEINFALQPIAGKKDLSVAIIPWDLARPGFDVRYQIVYKNVGATDVPSGEIVFRKDNRTRVVSAEPEENTATGDLLKWSYSNLKPGDVRSIFLHFRIAAPPEVNNYDTLSHLAYIHPADGDHTPADDTAVLKQLVTGSFDPNDKAESNAGSIPLSFVTNGHSLQYTIRFQNTGTDTAFTVVVRDTLSQRLEAGTLEMVTASHPYTLNIENGVNLAWTFPNILLPDSNRNEPASHGLIVYRIRPKSDLTKGEIVHNTASIYFDYNLPIVTNDAATVVQTDLITLPQNLLHFYGYLKNGSVQLHWKIAKGAGIKRFLIERSTEGETFQQAGTRVAVTDGGEYAFTDPVAGLPGDAFFYRLRMLQMNGGAQVSKSLSFRRENALSGTLEVYPNPAKKQGWIVYNSAGSGKAMLQVLNAAGAVVSTWQVLVQKGRNVYPFAETASLRPGMYTVQVIEGKAVSSKVVIIQ
jgi:uncharacterized repeat protein (TIGR01451 family)